MPLPSTLVPLGTALQQAGFKKKAWGKLLEARLVEPAQRIPGSKLYGLDNVQVGRLNAIALHRERLGEHYTLAAIAFELARSGDRSVPIDLIKEQLRGKIVRGQGWIRRAFQRYLKLSPDLSRVTEHDVNVAAKKIARKFTKNAPNSAKLHDFFLFYSAMMLRMMYLGRGVNEYAGNLAEMMAPFVRINHPFKGITFGMSLDSIRDNAQKLAEMISDMRESLRLDEENVFFARLDEIPDEVLRRFLEMLPRVSTIMWRSWRDVATVIHLPTYSTKEREAFDYALLLTLIAHYDHEHPTDTYQELLAGSTAIMDDLAAKLVATVKGAVKIQQLVRSWMRK